MRWKTASLLTILVALSGSFLTGPARATDFSVSSIARNDLIDGSGVYRGTQVSESKLSQDTAYQSGNTVYGPNNPFMYSSLMASIKDRCDNCVDYYTLTDAQVTVRITDSSGVTLSTNRISNLAMLDSPHSTKTDDYLNMLCEMYNYLNGVPGLPTLPASLCNGQPPSTGIGSDANSVWARWVNTDGRAYDKGIDFRFQPNFPNPGVYTVAVTAQADEWLIIPGAGGFPVATATASYSFTYVYENDANIAGDAGNDFGTARPISPGTYGGLLYGADSQDWYQVYVTKGSTISASLSGVAPISGCQPTLQLYSPKGSLVASSFNCFSTEALSARAKSSGYWRILIYIDTTVPKSTYTFSVSA